MAEGDVVRRGRALHERLMSEGRDRRAPVWRQLGGASPLHRCSIDAYELRQRTGGDGDDPGGVEEKSCLACLAE